jgi:hypothetical protein
MVGEIAIPGHTGAMKYWLKNGTKYINLPYNSGN